MTFSTQRSENIEFNFTTLQLWSITAVGLAGGEPPLVAALSRLMRWEMNMQGFKISRRLAAVAAISLCVAPTAASAAYTPAPQFTGSYSPIVTLSVLGSGISAAALCGAVAASAAQAPAGGCVLPAVDAPPPVAVVEPVPPPPVYVPAAVAAPASTGFLVPLIGGLAALVGVLALIAFGKGNPRGGGLVPPPISPQ